MVLHGCCVLAWNKWSEEDGRFWCGIIDELTAEEKSSGLHVGLGCNHPYNEWRKRMVLKVRNERGQE